VGTSDCFINHMEYHEALTSAAKATKFRTPNDTAEAVPYPKQIHETSSSGKRTSFLHRTSESRVYCLSRCQASQYSPKGPFLGSVSEERERLTRPSMAVTGMMYQVFSGWIWTAMKSISDLR